MERTRVEFRGDVDQGAHRLLLQGSRADGLWQEALVALRERIQDHRYWSGWDPSFMLDVVGAQVEPERATVYLAGSISEWRALEAANAGVPAIEAAARLLQRSGARLDSAICESRPIELAGYERLTGTAPWPWPVRALSNEVTTVRPHGAIGHGQLEALATALVAAIHATGDRYGEPGLSVVEGDSVRLTESVPFGAALQIIQVWTQVCWVEMSLVELSFRNLADSLLDLVPSRRAAVLRAALGRTLVDVERLLTRTPSDFGRACGATQLRFDDGTVHTLGVLGPEASVTVREEVLAPSNGAAIYSLRDAADAEGLKGCLGQRCEDVRVWEQDEGGPSMTAREVAVSYVLSNGVELFYLIHLDEARADDHLLVGDEVPRDAVTRWFSVREVSGSGDPVKHGVLASDIVDGLRSRRLQLSTLDDLVYEPVVDPRIERELEALLTDDTPSRLPGNYGQFYVSEVRLAAAIALAAVRAAAGAPQPVRIRARRPMRGSDIFGRLEDLGIDLPAPAPDDGLKPPDDSMITGFTLLRERDELSEVDLDVDSAVGLDDLAPPRREEAEFFDEELGPIEPVERWWREVPYTEEDIRSVLRTLGDPDPVMRAVKLQNLGRAPTGDERVVAAIRKLLDDDAVCLLQIPLRFGEIRLLAGYALFAEQCARGVKEPVRVRCTEPLTADRLAHLAERHRIRAEDLGSVARTSSSPYARQLAEYELLRSRGQLQVVDILVE